MHEILIENKDIIKDSHKVLIHIVNIGTDNYYFLNHTSQAVKKQKRLNIKHTQLWENVELYSTKLTTVLMY